ncbi:cobalt-precorrin-6A reductase [Argonema antarcticum]|uniref:cobalt-precorrin-6A reductase n=1 Tax=Argonema antarcticum TaxID=2942763 RepID=UPI00201156F0|nr:cobalt-precorrin-6A reductase [Argonema antarcticum]MCL1470751.1 cobalt-precorrin-6A reductase [Argonema antarcticum A004/B2]
MQYQAESSGRLWLIGGTTESVQLAAALAQAQLPCTISVATETARSLYPDVPLLRVWVGRMDAAQIGRFLQAQKIVAVLDASHPYAVEISQNAIAASTQLQIPYLRYERPRLERGSGEAGAIGDLSIQNPKSKIQNPKIIHLDSFATLVAGEYLEGQRVLLTVGYKALPLFRPWQERSTLFARVLPASISIEAAITAGFTPERLFAMRPPISADLENALWRHWQISMVVTKASGASGGEDIKRTLADELGVSLVVIEPPLVEYPKVTSDLSEAIEFCLKYS